MAADEDVAAGLLNWVNSLEVSEPVHAINDLSDGEVVWKLLQHVENLAFPGSLPEDPTRIDAQSRESWISRWTNLKHIYDALSIFLVEECDQRLPMFTLSNTNYATDPDLKAIAQHASLPDAVLLLKLCVVSASLCSERIEFLTRMQQLDERTQKVLMETLQEVQPPEQVTEEHDEDKYEEEQYADEPDAELNTPSTHPNSHEQIDTHRVESDLAFEERLAKVIADNQRIAHEKRDLQRRLNDLNSRYGNLQDRLQREEDELNNANERLNAVLSGRGGISTSSASQESKQEILIASLEAKVADADIEIEELRKNNEILRLKADRTQKLQDDYDEIKIERDKLARKANTAEKYRQKLETYQEMERENTSLKTKVNDLQTQLRQSDSRSATSGDLQREVDEYRKLLPGLEQSRHELGEMKKRLEYDHHVLQAQYSESEEQLRRSRQEIEYLQGRLRDYDDGVEPTSYPGNEHDHHTVSGNTLEQEEADFAAAEARLTEALQKENVKEGEMVRKLLPDLASLDENGISEDELRAIMAAMRAQMLAGATTERESGMKMQKRLVVMLEKLRTRNSDLVQYIQSQKEIIAESRQEGSRSPERVAEDAKVAEPKVRSDVGKTDAELEQQLEDQDVIIENLKREIKLISSAWYEQNQRFATLGAGGGRGAVALMRLKGGNGVEEPRSFLGRQRRLVDRAATGVGISPSRQSAR